MLPQPKQQQPLATVEGLLTIPEDRRFHEILNGELIRKTSPSFEHGDAQSALVMEMKRFFQLRAEPFEAISLPVGALFGDDDEAVLVH